MHEYQENGPRFLTFVLHYGFMEKYDELGEYKIWPEHMLVALILGILLTHFYVAAAASVVADAPSFSAAKLQLGSPSWSSWSWVGIYAKYQLINDNYMIKINDQCLYRGSW